MYVVTVLTFSLKGNVSPQKQVNIVSLSDKKFSPIFFFFSVSASVPLASVLLCTPIRYKVKNITVVDSAVSGEELDLPSLLSEMKANCNHGGLAGMASSGMNMQYIHQPPAQGPQWMPDSSYGMQHDPSSGGSGRTPLPRVETVFLGSPIRPSSIAMTVAPSDRPSGQELQPKQEQQMPPKVQDEPSPRKRTSGAKKRKSNVTKRMVKGTPKRCKMDVGCSDFDGSEISDELWEELESEGYDDGNDNEYFPDMEEKVKLLSDLEGTQGKRSPSLQKGAAKKSSGVTNRLVFKQYQCPVCKHSGDETAEVDVFDSEQKLLEHWQEFHMMKDEESDALICSQCPHRFGVRNTRSTLDPLGHMTLYLDHMVNKHGWEVPSFVQQKACPAEDCTHVALSKEAARIHAKTHSAEFTECPSCQKSFPKLQLGSHTRTCGKSATEKGIRSTFLNFVGFGCFLCETMPQFEGMQDMVTHIEEHHIGKNPKGRKVFTCPTCSQNFLLGQSRCYRAAFQVTLCFLLHHMIKKHDFPVPPFIKSFPCTKDSCKYFTVSYEALKIHLKMHGEKVTCSRCGTKCTQNSIYFHNRICQVSEKDRILFECDICKMAFKSKMTMLDHKVRKHQGTQTDVTVHKCFCCPYVCAREIDLLRHLYGKHKINMKELPVYSCKMCDYTHIHHLAVEKHKAKVHSTKEFLCPHCGKVFRHASEYYHYWCHQCC